MSPARISAADIPADVRKKLGITKARAKRSMTMDTVRSYAIRVLHVLHELSPAERARILKHALKVNDV